MIQQHLQSRPILARFFYYLLCPMITGLIVIYCYLRSSVPGHEASVALPSLQGPVTLYRGDGGVARLKAGNLKDAYMALGYLHAQDRLWQMEYKKRLGRGELSEVFGRKALDTDKYMLTLGLYDSAMQAVKMLTSEERSLLNAYVVGVNAWIKRVNVLPLEFYITGTRPRLWTLADSLLQIKLLSLELSGNYQQELEYNLVSKKAGRLYAELLLHEDGDLATDYYSSDASQSPENNSSVGKPCCKGAGEILTMLESLRNLYIFGGEMLGSNAWVVAGKYTASGKPVLAADPHLRNQIPSVWYLAEFDTPGQTLAGATVPGLPLFIFGSNRHIAWGITNIAADVQDLYLERFDEADASRYAVDGHWEPIAVTEHRIKVKPDFPAFLRSENKPFRWLARSTRHGPLITDVMGSDVQPMALSWVTLRADDRSYHAFSEINRAQNAGEFKNALESLVSPVLNFVYADQNNNIGMQIAGAVPVRNKGDGKHPVPGWTSEYDWKQLLHASQLPGVENPSSGVVVSANNQFYDQSFQYLISNSWKPSFRAERIEQLVTQMTQAEGPISAKSFAAVQGDQLDMFARSVVPLAIMLEAETERQQEALDYLKNWDYSTSVDSVGATIFINWMRHYASHLVNDELKGSLLYFDRANQLDLLSQVVRPRLIKESFANMALPVCDILSTQNQERCADVALMALTDTIEELERFSGSNMKRWSWGSLHKTENVHPAFTQSNFLKLLFDRDIPSGGSEFTINMSGSLFSKDDGYTQIIGPTYRQIIDLGNMNESLFMSNTGQSGNVLSPEYDSYMKMHYRMDYLRMFGLSTAGTEKTTVFEPAAMQ